MRILGIDPGTLHAGWGIIDEDGSALRYVASGCVRARGDDVATRLAIIFRELCAQIELYQPQEVAVETVFTGNNPRTAVAIGEARGVALLSASQSGLPVVGYEPSVVKKAVTGSGKAGKEQVMQMVRVLLSLPQQPQTDHEADALGMAIAHSRRRQFAELAGQVGGLRRNSRGSRRRR